MNYQTIRQQLDGFAQVPELGYLDSATSADIERTLRLHETLTAELRELEATAALEKYQLSLIEDPLTKALQENIHAAKSILIRRRCIDLQGSMDRIERWLSDINS